MSIDYSQFKGTYDGSSIGVESGLKAIAKQATMYLGSKGPNGLKYQIGEIIDNSIDELTHLNSTRVDKSQPLEIELELYQDGAVRVKDCGRGVPVGINPKTGRPSIEAVFESTSAGGKSYNVSNSGYGKVNRGVHGAGAAVVAATSSSMAVIVTTIEDDCTYIIRYGKQERTQELTKIGHMKDTKRAYGTEVIWKYDKEIFKAIDITKEYPFKIDEIENMLRLYCYTTQDIRYIFKYTLPGKQKEEKTFNANDYDLSKVINNTIKGPLFDKELVLNDGEYSLRIICGVTDNQAAKYFYTNGLVMEKSSQATLFPKLMQKIVKDSITRSKLYDKECPVLFKAESHLNYALLLSANNPEYTAQHKNIYEDAIFEKLLEKEFIHFMLTEGGEFLRYLMQTEVDRYKQSLDKVLAKRNSRESKRQAVAVSREDLVYISNLTYSKAPYYMSDLIIVEGNSAGTHAKPLLKPNQALISIQGLFPNAYTMKEEAFINSTLFKPLKEALAFNWKRIILFSDPDPIGGSIQCLLLVMLSKYYSEYLDNGQVYILKAPLYMAYSQMTKPEYIYTESEKELYLENKPANTTLTKHKGLGALSQKDMLYILDYTLDESDTRIDQIDPKTLPDGLATLETLYGKNPAYRKTYVLSNYATYTLVDYFNKKKSKRSSQTIGFDISNDLEIISNNIGYTGNLITEDDYNTSMSLLNSMY